MTRVGMAIAALTAAAITAGSLGFAVFWAYAPRDLPPVATEVPPDAGQVPATVTASAEPVKPSSTAAPQSAAPATAPSQPAATQESVAALQQPAEPPREAKPVASEPQIGVVRGSRRAPSRPVAKVEPKPAAPHAGTDQTATDARPIQVLRGGRGPRYAMARIAEPTPRAELLLIVFRGARPRPMALTAYVQPSALILHIPR